MKDISPRDDETLDALSCGSLCVLQKKQGYRYSLDAYLLSAFVDERPGTGVLDIGSGSGVISILLAAVKGLLVTGVEIQEPMAEMSRRSVALAGLQERVRIVNADFRDYNGPGTDVVVVNPPYRPVRAGRLNPDQGKAVARHEILLDLDTLLDKAYNSLNQGGRFYIVYPVWRLPDLMECMRSRRIEPKNLVLVHSTRESTADICLVRGIRDAGKELLVSRPFIVFKQEGIYSEEMDDVFKELRFPKSH